MPEQKRKFVGVLKVELEDLAFDIEDLMKNEEAEYRAGRLTDYVYQENAAVLGNELKGVRLARRELDGLDPDTYDDLGTLISAFLDRIRSLFREEGIVGAAETAILRKIDKVRRYVLRQTG